LMSIPAKNVDANVIPINSARKSFHERKTCVIAYSTGMFKSCAILL
jgi:hypothetical protein